MRGILSLTVLSSAIFLLLTATPASAASIQFDQSHYTVGPGGQVSIGITFDNDEATPGIQPIPEGLFAAGVRVYWDSDIAGVLNTSDVLYNPGFDDTLFTMVDVQPDNGGFLAFIDFSSPVVTDTHLGDFVFTAGSNQGLMNLHVTFYYDKTGEETLDDFLDGDGTMLDQVVSFGDDATLEVVPEPMTILLMAGGLAGVLAWRKRLSSKT